MADAEDFLIHLMPLVPTCPIPLACDAVRDALTRLCERAHIWRHRLTHEVLATDDDVALTLPAGAVVADIERAWFNGCELTSLGWASMSPLDLAREDAVPRFITQATPDRVVLQPRFDGTLEISVWLKPDESLPGYGRVWPDFILQHHGRTLAYGAAARLMTLPDKSWTEPATAGVYSAVFEADLDRLIHKTAMGQQRAPLRARASFF